MAKPTKEQVDALKLKRLTAKYGTAASKKKKKSTLDATKKKSDATSGKAPTTIKGIAEKRKSRHQMLRDI